jgi:hypothetical protein
MPPPEPRLEQVYDLHALLQAFQRARRAKRGRGEEPAFYWALEEELLALSQGLQRRTWRPDPYRYFTLRNAKRRVVSEASFRDRVVHHALVAALEPAFEPRFIAHSYACRRGKGGHAALRRVQAMARRYPYALRMDIQRYFDHIDHPILLRLLARRAPDHGLGWLCAALLEGACVPTVPPGTARGVPIGNLTSQFWANVYLDPLDHLVVDTLGVGSYARYMDDMIAFSHDKAALWELKATCKQFLTDTLQLPLKESATLVTPVSEGVPWLGFRVFPHTIRLREDARRRLGRHLRRLMRYAHDPDAQARFALSAQSACAHAAAANTFHLRQGMIDRLLRAWPEV